jgi:hypothetical protein
MAFGMTIGGAAMDRAFVGETPVKRIYAGDKHVWPPISTTVTYVSSQVFTGTTNTSFPTHSTGDLLVVVSAGGTAPAGWTVAHQTSTGAPVLTMAWKIAPGAGTGTGSWLNNLIGCMYVYRGMDAAAPVGAVGSSGGTGTVASPPELTLTGGGGESLVTHCYYNNGSSGIWVNKIPGNFLSKNQNARIANNQMIDTRASVADSSSMTHTVSAAWRGLAFEVLAPQPVTYDGLYGVRVEYLDNYVVNFTALTSYAADPEEAFFFRCVQMPRDGYVGREFQKTWAVNGYGALDCTLEEYWATPSGVMNKLNFRISPRAVGNGVVEEIIP